MRGFQDSQNTVDSLYPVPGQSSESNSRGGQKSEGQQWCSNRGPQVPLEWPAKQFSLERKLNTLII